MKREIIIKILYVCAALCFCTYLATRKSYFMFSGGLLLIVASTMLIINSRHK